MEFRKYNVNEIINNLLKKYNTLLDCPVKFHGDYGGQKIQQFIECIKSYKTIKSISDEQALGELGYLLTDHAYSWWHRRKCFFTTWSEAITALQNQYCRQRPAFLVYKDIFEHKYEDYTKETDFIDDKYELLTELSDPKQSEKNKLDMIFALLPQNVQTKLEYGYISSVAELREQIVKLKKDKDDGAKNYTSPPTTNEASENSNTTTVNGMEIVEPKVEQNVANSETETSNVENSEINQSESGTEVMPHTICIENDKDSIIKVRRTEDLMAEAVIKSENIDHDDDTTMTDKQEEFIHVNHQEESTASENRNFQIDLDIMDQINTIIDESEMNCESNQSLHHTPIMSVQENVTNITIDCSLNGETTMHAEVSKNPHPVVSAANSPTPQKAIRVCSYCYKYNHVAQYCLKRKKHMQLFKYKLPARERKMENIANNVNNNNNNNSNGNSCDIEASVNKTLSNETTATTYTQFSKLTSNQMSASLFTSAQENATNKTTVVLHNRQTNIPAEVLKKPHPAVAAANNPTPNKAKLRCSYCRKCNHTIQNCPTKAKHDQLLPKKSLSKKSNKEDITNNVNNNNNNNSNNDDVAASVNKTLSNAAPTSFSTSTSMQMSALITTSATGITIQSSPTIMTCVNAAATPPTNPVVSHNNSSLSQNTSTTYSHITTMSSNPPTPNASLTTKLIPPIDGPGLSKLLAAKLRNTNGPSPKCHQCDTVGFYKSICPNCSPIYNSNQQYK
ncbi:uncharacterized protein isoform X1 [Musca autumnalis]|uniref:uncharacterized protein isoform X1 n=1 Tax=Musca autumnalis TaxID=221902 RepID=UPI003CE6D1B7